ncbi:MAG: hypothetical protein ACFCVE_00190 [Phycisphaerae bacterium]
MNDPTDRRYVVRVTSTAQADIDDHTYFLATQELAPRPAER